MGTDFGFLKYRINDKYQKAKVKNLEQMLDFQKYNTKKAKQNRESYIKQYEICFKNRVFFSQGNIRSKNEN